MIDRIREFPGRVKSFFTHVMEELHRCTWPTGQELSQSTIVVVLSVMILTVWVASWDMFFAFLLKLFA
jgi:preprotein translocase SecE subunit